MSIFLDTEKTICDPVGETLCPINRMVHDYWISAKGDHPFPPLSALDPVELPRPALPYFTVVEVVEPGPRFLVRLIGTEVHAAAGQDHTGRMVDEMPGAEDVVRRFTWCVRARRPYCVCSKLLWSINNFRQYEALVLPFGPSGGRIEKLASVVYFP